MEACRTRRIYLVFVCLLTILALETCCAQTAKPSLAPLNPEFVQYQQAVSSGQALAEEGYGLGAIPTPVDLSHMKSVKVDRGILSLPTTYDLRTTGKLTSIKNQGSCGSCWAFAAYGSMESCLLPGESRNFSENNLKNLSGFDVPCCDGGNELMTAAYLTRWSGPINEVNDPYNAGSCTSPGGLAIQKHVQDVIFLPNRSGYTDNDAIKQAVMTYGAVYMAFQWNSSYYNSSNYTYYYNGSYTLNHAVCIVGWDDNFDRTKFSPVPPANGAFIVKNSWGTSWGQSGYFYQSYYDTTVAHDNTVFCGNSPISNYDRIYQYDPLGWVTSVGYGSNTAWGANIFTSVENGKVLAAGFYAASPGTTYDAYVYLNPNSGPINTSGWAARKTGTLTDAGYRTIVFDTSVSVGIGQKFSIVVKLTTPDYTHPIPLEYPISGYSSAATAHSGESYISSNGNSWSDLASSYANTNACIKAYSIYVNPTIPIADAKRLPNGGDPIFLSGGIVTGVFGSIFYVQAADCSSGISVYKSGNGMAVGMRADILGTPSTNISGEKYINATSVTQNGAGAAEPLLLINRGVGGADWEYDPATGAGQKGIKDAIDLNNIGLLVCTSGKVTYVGINYFYMDDGSGCQDNSQHPGVKVSVTGLPLPALNKHVKVSAVSSCFQSGDNLYRLLRPTSITVTN